MQLRTILAAALVFPATIAAAQPRPAAPDPYALFARARTFFAAQKYPPYLRYDVVVRVVDGGTPKSERYTSAYDSMTNDVWVEPVSDYERDHPPSGSGVNLGILGFRVGKPQPPVDFLGVPHLTPAYSFGIGKFVATQPPHRPTDAELVAEIRKEFHDPNPRATAAPAPTPSGLLQIADVAVYKRDYVISLAGEESVNGHECYHLALQPVRAHDGRYRLRDVWIDETTYATERLKESINFTDGPGTTVPWTVDFTDAGGAHYVSDERADAPMAYRGLIYTQASVSFENIAPAAEMPRARDVPLTNDLVMDEPIY